MTLSSTARALWAKSGSGDDWHPLVAHLLDVAACARAILEREPPSTLALYAADLGLDERQALAWVCALAGLHDLGKASPAFQQKWDEGKRRVWAAGLIWSTGRGPTPPPNDVPHNVISQTMLRELLETVGWSTVAAWRVADAVGAHHGFRARSRELDRAEDSAELGDATWDAARQEVFDAIVRLCEASEAPPRDALTGAAFERIAGLTSFADWIGSSLPRAPLGDDLGAYQRDALDRARGALDGIGWMRRAPLLSAGSEPLGDVFRYLSRPDRPFRARPLQDLMEELLDDAAGPTLFLVEAPMGEGKTEAALYAHLRLQGANQHRGLYVALPTQATGNAMFERVTRFLAVRGATRPDVSPIDLQLLHGATLLNRRFQSLIVRFNVAGDGDGEGPESPDRPEEGVQAGEWFTHRKRALLSEYGVGTVDQALLAILRTKHQFVRLWGLGNRVVVLDEVHAYDTYTGTLIESLVRWLRALGSSVILLSATLPAAKRRALLEAWGAGEIDLADYPRITRVAGGSAVSRHFRGREQPTLVVERAPYDSPELAALLRDLARNGGCVACIVNTVKRAQELFRALAADGDEPTPLLFHARYPADERRAREEQVLDTFGEGTEERPVVRPPRAILIATQVVEQSLDLDFDVLVTDIAPIDLILQRAGRLHRHHRDAADRRGHTTPVLFLAGPATGAAVPSFGEAELIYERYVLLRTWLALRDRAAIELPRDIDRLVQEVYGTPDPDGLEPALADALRQASSAMNPRKTKDETAALYAAFGEPNDEGWLDVASDRRLDDDAIDVQADDDRPLARTRRGRPGVTIIPIHAHAGRYYLDAAYEREVRFRGRVSRDDAVAWYGRSVRLSRWEVVEGIDAHVASHGVLLDAWRKVPLLAHCAPLILEDGRARVGNLVVRLDPALGIVYE